MVLIILQVNQCVLQQLAPVMPMVTIVLFPVLGKIEVGGYICKPVGRISMDSLVIDISNVPEAYLAEISQVCLLGEHYNAKDMASDLSTISYEILTNLGSRPKRLYKK
ncbi:MAG: hypothetical protein CM15mP117_01800 [Alphaproteobacteria bacterium]|nr:MAG: hypothetical protein CM15mP117_01800 [Alphaproteobacteria bacterium]